MKHLRFCCCYVGYNEDDPKNTGDVKRLGSMHPQKAMSEMGISYQHATPQSMSDKWWFWNCDNVPECLPPFLTELKLDPLECIGFGLNKETAEMIKNYKGESA